MRAAAVVQLVIESWDFQFQHFGVPLGRKEMGGDSQRPTMMRSAEVRCREQELAACARQKNADSR
jgi:hypothetical protein